MSAINEISAVGDFLQVVKRFSPGNEKIFYRGKTNSNHGINLSLYRLLQKEKLKPLKLSQHNFMTNKMQADEISQYVLAHELYETFKTSHILYPDVNIISGYAMNEIDLHVAVQHYGLSTRFIDWSKGPLIAQYFFYGKRRMKTFQLMQQFL
ncbi:TPA: FRG domain-containing protein [Citrobacter koseri]|uniref:FRG domain-containing protein n=1 Tax=Citrobacter koseri TaxID=545 RepID=UPI003890161D|nr:FRG domain-containing protein [Citrobacter koseri]